MSHPGEEMAQLPLAKLYGLISMQTTFFILLGIAFWWLAGRDIAEFVSFDLEQIALGAGLAAGLGLIGYSIFRLFPKFGERLVRDQAQQYAFLDNGLGPGGIVFIAACAGIGEEILFRGGLMTLLDVYAPFALALIVSSALFTIIHFAKPVVAALIFAMGLFFGLAFWISGSLLAVMLAHWLYDIWALWFIQREMHRLGVFEQDAPATPAPEQEADSH